MAVVNPVMVSGSKDATATAGDIAFGKTAYTAEGLITGTGVVVTPGEEYIGITSRSLIQVTSSQSTITFYSSLKDHSEEPIILRDYAHQYFVLPYPDAGMVQELLLAAADGTSGAIQIQRKAAQRLGFQKDALIFSCADAAQPVSRYLEAYGFASYTSSVVS